MTSKECRSICKHARLRELSKYPLRTLRSYKAEMEICLKHLKIFATNHYEKGLEASSLHHGHLRAIYELRT
ncbi:unnamed protein product, partial [Brassica oleracea var. botrytis]